MTSRRAWSVLLGLVLALAVFAPPAQAVTTVTLSAHVTNSDGLDQAGSVCLELAAPGSSCGGTNLTSGGVWSRTWDVDANPGSYLIRVTSSTMDGHTRWYVAGDNAGTTDRSAATPVNLGPGAVDLHFDMVMPAIAKVTGTLLDNHGAPVAGAHVGRNQSGHQTSVITQADGSYDFGYVRAGAHSLSVSPVGDYAGTSGSMTVPASGAYVVDPPLVVQKAASIHGHVTDSVSGAPLPLVEVQVFTAGSHTYQGSAYTDLNGDYRINQLGNQDLVARFSDEFGGYASQLSGGGDPVTWVGEVPFTLAADTDTAKNMGLTAMSPAVPTHNLSGTVTDDGGHPLPGIAVTSPDDQSLYDVTDRLGHWYLDTPPGSYRLQLRDDNRWGTYVFGTGPSWFPEFYPDAAMEAAGLPVTVVAGVPQSGLDVTLGRGAYIQGAVRETGDPSPANFSTHWSVYGTNGQVALEQDPGYFSGASYSVLVRPGTWRLLLRSQRFVVSSTVDYLPRWLGDTDSFEAATQVTVAAGDTVTVADTHVGSSFAVVASPAVSGTPAVGGVLTASTGTWSTMTGTRYDVTWWRGPTQVGSGATYQVAAADAGDAVRARVVATNGSHTATADSAPVTIARVASAVTGRGTSRKAGAVKLTVTVSAAGPTPAGTLTIKRGARVVKRDVVLVGGRAVVTLKRQPSGVRRFTASYSGAAQTLPATSASIRVKVR